MTEVPVALREGRPEDLEAIREFTTDTFAWGDYVPDEYLDWLAEPSGAVLVAADAEDRVLAMVHIEQLSPKEGWLSAARVRRDYQRRGLGSRLNQAGVDWLRTRGALVVRLTTEENNLVAQQQVEKLGYRPVARFALAERKFAQHGIESNGGRRLPGPERLDLAPAAETEPAYLVWSTGDLNRASHGLYASKGWAFRRLALADLVSASRGRRFWASPAAWAIAEEDKGLWVSALLTTPDEAERAVRSLVDLAEEKQAEWMGVMVPRVDWLESALQSQHLEINYPNIVYEKAI
ncbi:MAG TPA: GNAT family N-acetyltransferase [Acidimicrobiia bacterium]|nr:GNAT family N-acetyltransferase [Acidimicrobiia bacterium]